VAEDGLELRYNGWTLEGSTLPPTEAPMPFPRLHRPLVTAFVAALAVAACEDRTTPLDPTGDQTDTGPVPQSPTPFMAPLMQGAEGYAEIGEVRTGYILGPTGRPMFVTYEVHEGLAIWQGDIVIGEADEIAPTLAELRHDEPGPLRGVVIDGADFRWPGGVIPYTIDDATEAIVLAAIAMVENQTPGVTLVQRTIQDNYVTFRDATGCSSEIGMIGGQQFINLKVDDGDTFCSAGNAAHEILHALGMYHEHTRCDRDDFVTIDYDEIEEDREGNFFLAGAGSADAACGTDQAVFDIGDYDPGSIMHYGQLAFAIGTNPTIIPKAGVDGSVMGQRDALGPTDVETVDQLYGANNASPQPSIVITGQLLEGSTITFDASGSTDADDAFEILTFAWSLGDGTCPAAAKCSNADLTHVYANDGNYGYSVIVSDGFDTGAMGATLDILNVVPDVSAGADVTLNEGSKLLRSGSFTDPGADPWVATVDYGDGGGEQPLSLSGKSFQLDHTYVDDAGGPFTLTVGVTDDHETGTDQVQVTVNNVAPTVNAGPDATVESGQPYSFSGSFSDPGVVDHPWAWALDWGNGEGESGSTNDQSASITASLNVCQAGTYTVELTVTDKDDGVGSDALTLTVPHVAVEIDILPGSDTNPLRFRGGNLPVAILGSADLNVRDIDPSTLTLGDEDGADTAIAQKNNGTYEAYLEDVNGDGFQDLVVMFPTRDVVMNEVTETTTELVLRGFQADACTHIRGVDTVSTRGF
jgi:hypothetical protein